MAETKLEKTLKEYYKAKRAAEVAQEIVKELGETVTELLLKTEDKKAEIPEAKFTIVSSITYKFSKAVEKEEDGIKEETSAFNEKMKLKKEIVKTLKETEIAEGKAEKVSESFSTRMLPNKEK